MAKVWGLSERKRPPGRDAVVPGTTALPLETDPPAPAIEQFGLDGQGGLRADLAAPKVGLSQRFICQKGIFFGPRMRL